MQGRSNNKEEQTSINSPYLIIAPPILRLNFQSSTTLFYFDSPTLKNFEEKPPPPYNSNPPKIKHDRVICKTGSNFNKQWAHFYLFLQQTFYNLPKN